MATYFVAAGSGTPNSGTFRGIFAASTTYAIGDKVAPSQAYATAAARGYVYECTTAGTTAATEPTWVYATPDTSTTTSGTAVFTCRNPDTWAKAGVYLDQALQRATANGDVVVIQYNAVPSVDAELAADTTWTVNANISLVSASNDGASAYTLTPMGATAWIGNSTTNRSITFSGTDNTLRTKGLTLRVSGATADDITLCNSLGQHAIHEDVYLWQGSTATAGADIILTVSSGGYCELINPTFRFANANPRVKITAGSARIIGGSISSAGVVPAIFAIDVAGELRVEGMDLSNVTGTLVGNSITSGLVTFANCKLANGVIPLAAQTSNPTAGGAKTLLLDCAFGNTQGFFGYYDAYGQVTTDTGIYKTANNSGNRSWKIATTGYASFNTPFTTPTIDVYHSGTVSVTPYLEILRDGSATAYKNNEVWGRFMAKTTSGFTLSSRYEDAQAFSAYLAGTAGVPQDAGAGVAGWTGVAVPANAWSGKIDTGAAILPAEAGSLTAQICVGLPSATVYVDPEIRGL
ncbi:MAG: hypothetical protein ACOYZ7_09000 [Chloroflexota bacterium]